MTSPPSNSDAGDAPRESAYFQLDERIQRWVWEQRWDDLRPIQEMSIPAILAGDRDVILSAATAAGKTEAAFLPICSRIVDAEGPGIRALYVGPLKALINDQFGRLELLCEHLHIPVHRWHGDVDASAKERAMKDPRGILLITPESLEARLVLSSGVLRNMLAPIQYVVIDELHAFIGTERGRHLQSLVHRLDLLVQRSPPRIGLSATLGDMELAANFLRPGRGGEVVVANPPSVKAEKKIQVRGYAAALPPRGAEDVGARDAIATHLFEKLRGKNNLVFADSRRDVESLADALRVISETRGVPNEFFAHHGSLDRDHRERLEQRLKAGREPTTAICTSTLEMGIDIGSVESVAQVGVPHGVASLQQRMGRSGRKPGKAATLRVYVTEAAARTDADPQDALREQLVQAIAVVQLLLEKWYEPPRHGALHLSTLVHQILAFIAQQEGATAARLHDVLCKTGPFAAVTPSVFAELLRGLGARQVLMQAPDGLLLLGQEGESLVGHHTFFSVFQTREEFRVVCGGDVLGSLPVEQHLLAIGECLLFAGRPWQITNVDEDARVIEVRSAPRGRAPRFAGGVGFVHDRVRARMREIYAGSDEPIFLDDGGVALLRDARVAWRSLGLDAASVIDWRGDVLVYTWCGDVIANTLALMLRQGGLSVVPHGAAVRCQGTTVAAVVDELAALAANPPPDAPSLAVLADALEREKFDSLVPPTLLARDYASRHLDVPGALSAVAKLTR